MKAKIESTEFTVELSNLFGYRSMTKIMSGLEKLDVLPPIKEDEFFHGCDGIMIFMEDYGVAVKIEKTESKFGSRVIHPNSLQPLFQQAAGKAIIDVIPGINLDRVGIEDVYNLWDELNKDGVHFRDYARRNMGFIPFQTKEETQGIPATIDSLSVIDSALRTSLENVIFKRPLRKKHLELRKSSYLNSPQEIFYRPLVKAFNESFADKRKMQETWQLCSRFKNEGKLIDGWNEILEKDPELSKFHPDKVVIASKKYKLRKDKSPK